MKKFLRALSLFLALLFTGAAAFLLVVTYNLVPRLSAMIVMPAWAGRDVVLAVGVALLLLALILLSLGLRRGQRILNASLKGGEYGEILIAIPAIEDMVERVISQTEGVREAARHVRFKDDGLTVQIRIDVMPDLPLPTLISELQSRTKEYLEEITGITVQSVKVQVGSIIKDQPGAKKPPAA